MTLDLQSILTLLAPTGGANLLYEIALYIIFFLALMALFLMPDKNLIPTLLLGGTLLFAVVAKLSLAALAVGQQPIFRRADFGFLIINVAVFIFPLLAAGVVRTKRRKNYALPLSILAGLFGGAYFFLFWFFFQRNA